MAKFTQDRMYEMLGDIHKSSTKKHAKKIGIDYLSEFARGEEPDNGIITQEEIDAANTAMMKARLAYANEFGNPAAKRMINLPDEPYQFTGDEPGAGVPAGNIGTHFMSSMDNYAVPFIQQGPNGLYYNQNAGPEDKGAMKFDSPEDADYFAENYKDVSPGFLNQKKEGGALNKFIGGGPTDCPKDHVWDSNTKKCVKVYTLANDQKFIDGVGNWAMQSNDPDKITPEYNDQIKHYLYSGAYGYDPITGTLHKLPKEQKTVADAETKKILAKQDDNAAYRQSIIDAGFDPETFGKSKGTNVITGEQIYGDKSKEDVDKINKEAVNDFVTEGHRKAILESPFNIAAFFTPPGMAAGVMQGSVNLLPDIYNFGKDPSWSTAGAVGMDALMMLPAAKGIGKVLGFKGVPKQLPGSPNAVSAPKSEINWAAWNSKTAKQKDLMNAYAEIERGTKAKGNWMKNADGTPFQGTPEQFVQQKSSWFKKSFPDYYGETLTTRSPYKFDKFDESKFGATDDGWFGKGIYTHPTKANAGRAYGDNAYDLYVNSANKGIAEGPYGGGAYMYKKDIDLVKKNFYDKWYKIKNSGEWDSYDQKQFESEYESLMGYIDAAEKNNINQYTTLDNPVGVANEIVIPFDNPVKSAKGNIGYFDLKNPIIYEKNGGSISQAKYGGLHKFVGGEEVTIDNVTYVKYGDNWVNKSTGVQVKDEGLIYKLYNTKPTEVATGNPIKPKPLVPVKSSKEKEAAAQKLFDEADFSDTTLAINKALNDNGLTTNSFTTENGNTFPIFNSKGEYASPEAETWVNNRFNQRYVENQQKNNYNDGPLEDFRPENYFIGGMGARAALIPLGETVSAKVGASALGQAIKAGWNTALPYTAGTLTTGNAVGLGFGMHGATTMKPNLDKFIAKPSLETGIDLGFSGLEILGSPGVGNMLMKGAKPIIDLGKAGVNKVGNFLNAKAIREAEMIPGFAGSAYEFGSKLNKWNRENYTGPQYYSEQPIQDALLLESGSVASVPGPTLLPIGTANEVRSAIPKAPFELQDLPGPQLKSLMSNGKIFKITEPKTGLVNLNQALGIIGQEKGASEKLAFTRQGLADFLKQGLDEPLPEKIDFNQLRRIVQEKIVPLKHQIIKHSSSDFGIHNLGYDKNNQPLENQTFIITNKDQFGQSKSGSHKNPPETLGHIHFLIDKDTPDIATITQMQSDPFQSTYNWRYNINQQTKDIGTEIMFLKDFLLAESMIRKSAMNSVKSSQV